MINPPCNVDNVISDTTGRVCTSSSRHRSLHRPRIRYWIERFHCFVARFTEGCIKSPDRIDLAINHANHWLPSFLQHRCFRRPRIRYWIERFHCFNRNVDATSIGGSSNRIKNVAVQVGVVNYGDAYRVSRRRHIGRSRPCVGRGIISLNCMESSAVRSLASHHVDNSIRGPGTGEPTVCRHWS